MSCGCLARELARAVHLKHGDSTAPEYIALNAMKLRCGDPNNQAFHNYGARGIKVCARWLGPDGYANFVSDVGRRPSSEHSIDRFPDNGGNYEPGNVRWATREEQQNNTRGNRRLQAFGETMTMTRWSRKTGIGVSTIWRRLRLGWTDERAVSAPVRRGVG